MVVWCWQWVNGLLRLLILMTVVWTLIYRRHKLKSDKDSSKIQVEESPQKARMMIIKSAHDNSEVACALYLLTCLAMRGRGWWFRFPSPSRETFLRCIVHIVLTQQGGALHSKGRKLLMTVRRKWQRVLARKIHRDLASNHMARDRFINEHRAISDIHIQFFNCTSDNARNNILDYLNGCMTKLITFILKRWQGRTARVPLVARRKGFSRHTLYRQMN